MDPIPQTVLIGRFAFGFKNYVPLVAGMSCMSIRQFQIYTVLGAVSYTTLIMGASYLIGENIETAIALTAQVGFISALAVTLIGGALIIGRRRHQIS